MIWIVDLRAIDWDDGKGEYDVSDLPTELDHIYVDADDSDEAIMQAMIDASDNHGFLIASALGAARRA
jgi:hypothetical protein